MKQRWGVQAWGRLWIILAVILFAVILFLPAASRNLGQEFLASLRIEKPEPVTAPSFTGPNASGRLRDLVGNILGGGGAPTLDEDDQPASDVHMAGQLAGFTPRLPQSRTDLQRIIVTGAQARDWTVNRRQLTTLFAQAGRPLDLPESVDGARVSIRTSRAIYAEFGNCPKPPANTLQNQIQGRPPPSTDNGNCVEVAERPRPSMEVPQGLDGRKLLEIALELSGMSPNQTQAFGKVLDWKSTLNVSMPRFMRSYEMVEVEGVPGMLLNTAGRRGPTYQLIWEKEGMVFSLTGYGSPADAVPLANSMS